MVGFSPSGRFTLTMDRIFTPPNDDFVDAFEITPGAQVSATTRGATRELREPGGEPHTIWFKLRVAAQADIHLSACNGSYPLLAVYTGPSVGQLTRLANAYSDCSITFTAVPGTTYRIVAGDGGSGGSFRLES